MVTHLRLMTHPVVIYPGSLIPKISWGRPQFFSIVVGFITTLTRSVINTTTINAYTVTCGLVWCGSAHLCSMWSCSAIVAKHILVQQSFLRWSHPPQAVQFNCGLCESIGLLPLGGGWPFIPELLKGPPCDIFVLDSADSNELNPVYLTSVVSRVWAVQNLFFLWFWCSCQSWTPTLWCSLANRRYWAIIVFIKTRTFVHFHV